MKCGGTGFQPVKEFQEKMNYIINNPVKANLVKAGKNYESSGNDVERGYTI